MDHKKEHIIETGRDLFEKKGYYNTSMQDVAEACGISKATLYKLFVPRRISAWPSSATW